MSVQFGRWNFDGKPVDESYLDRVRPLLSRYGPDGDRTYRKENTAILYYAFHTTRESHSETQPCLLPSGDVLCWDGRLDNRRELISQLGGLLSNSSTDLDIVAAAYERWRTDCLCKLLGDWALGIWSQKTALLILAKDFVGIRPLYYFVGQDHVIWSTLLDPLVLFSEQDLAVNEEYVAGWLSFYPAEHLTPYVGIYAVPSCSFVTLGPRQITTERYWAFNADKRTVCKTDAEYGEQFRPVFSEAVRRRLRADSAITAQLSGGMDSSSIVCMADALTAAGSAETPRLDTVSYYNDGEPNWDELPFISCVEAKRGRTGSHINTGTRKLFTFDWRVDHLIATPACVRNLDAPAAVSSLNRVVLSGVGGDEVMGGVPTPVPQLLDTLARAEFRELAHQLKLWALDKRVPWFHLLLEAIRECLPSAISGVPKRRRPALWLNGDFANRNKRTLRGYESRVRFFGPRPSFQMNISALDHLRRQLACNTSALEPNCEKRYPFLDRSLLEFVYSIPRSQLARPGRRRFLMRHALRGLVPEEIIERRRKAFVVRTPIIAITKEWDGLCNLCQHLISARLGFVNQEQLLITLKKAKACGEVPMTRLIRTIFTEVWLLNLRYHGILGESYNDSSSKLASLNNAPIVSIQ